MCETDEQDRFFHPQSVGVSNLLGKREVVKADVMVTFKRCLDKHMKMKARKGGSWTMYRQRG